jgi:hypothetical protein
MAARNSSRPSTTTGSEELVEAVDDNDAAVTIGILGILGGRGVVSFSSISTALCATPPFASSSSTNHICLSSSCRPPFSCLIRHPTDRSLMLYSMALYHTILYYLIY